MNEPQDKSAIALGPRIVASGGFTLLYKDGMGLIEEVAAYLDGDGRAESRGLPREASFVYATESMRLTTRLMQLASWLLLQRAVNEGELTVENARSEKEKVKFSATPDHRGGPGFPPPAATPPRLHRPRRPPVRPRPAVRQAGTRRDFGSGTFGERGFDRGSAGAAARGVWEVAGLGQPTMSSVGGGPQAANKQKPHSRGALQSIGRVELRSRGP